MKRLALIVSMGMLAAGCGDDGGGAADAASPDAPAGAANPGFVEPGETARAWTRDGNAWVEVGPANFACLGTPSADEASTVDITLTGLVTDFQEGTPKPAAEIEAFPGVDFGNRLATATANAEGSYELTLPAGQTRVAFKIAADAALDTYLLNQYFEPGAAAQELTLDFISEDTAVFLPAIIGVQPTPGLGILAGAIRDCDGNAVSDVIATVSSTSGSAEHLDGAATYYFSAGAPISLPVAHSLRTQTNSDGQFVVIELPPAESAYLQVWGFQPDQDPASAELTLLAEIPAPVIGSSVIMASLEPLRGE